MRHSPAVTIITHEFSRPRFRTLFVACSAASAPNYMLSHLHDRIADALLRAEEVDRLLSDPDTVRLHLMLTPPSIAPALVRGAVGLDQIDRTIVVRVETQR